MVDTVTTQALVTIVDIGSTLEGVGTRLSDGVDTTANEVRLAHVEGCYDHLYFLDSIEGNGVTTTRQLVGKTKVVIEVGTIDGEVGRTSVTTCETHAVGIRREPGDIRDTTVDGRHLHHLRVVNACRSTRFLGSKLGSLTADDDLGQLISILRHHNLQVEGLTKLKEDVLHHFRLEANIRNRHCVGATSTHTLDCETSRNVGNSSVAGS